MSSIIEAVCCFVSVIICAHFVELAVTVEIASSPNLSKPLMSVRRNAASDASDPSNIEV